MKTPVINKLESLQCFNIMFFISKHPNLSKIDIDLHILRRTERAMVRAMCGVKLMKKKRTEDLMEMLGLKETVVQIYGKSERSEMVRACVKEG